MKKKPYFEIDTSWWWRDPEAYKPEIANWMSYGSIVGIPQRIVDRVHQVGLTFDEIMERRAIPIEEWDDEPSVVESDEDIDSEEVDLRTSALFYFPRL